jgi:Mce-associated membrane protein
MSPRKRRSAVLDADDEAHQPPSVEEAEAAVADAERLAEAARARATELRRKAGVEPAAKPATRRRVTLPSRPSWLRLPGLKPVAAGLAIVVVCASLVVTGLMLWHHRAVDQQRLRAAEFSAAARQSVVTMMTIDPSKAREDVQHIIDNSTGVFQRELKDTSDAMITSIEKSKVATKVDIQSVALESMTADSAIVLVAAVSDVTDPDQKKRAPVTWRISVTMKRDGDQLKMSKFEFV